MPQYLIARIGEESVALETAHVGSVVEIERIAPVPRVPRHVAGLCALRSRVLTVIDARAAIGEGSVDRTCPIAVVCDVDGHGYALLFDAVDDVVEAAPPEPCPVAFDPVWAGVATGLVQIKDRSMLLLDPAALVAGPATTG